MAQEITQDAFMIMERLAALVATQGINEETIALANVQIQEIIIKIIKPTLVTMYAKNSGLLI
jgi:hypothetical protein